MIATFLPRNIFAVSRFPSLSWTPRRLSVNSKLDDVTWENAKPYDSIPGPKPLPIPKIGNFWRFMKFGPYGNLDTGKLLVRLREEFGDIIRVSGIGTNDFVFLADKKLIEKMFQQERKVPVRDAAESFRYYQEHVRPDIFSKGVGIAHQQGKEWQTSRSILNPIMMMPNSAKMYQKKVEGVADEFIERMRKLRDDKMELPDSYVEEISRWSLESLGYIAYDMRFGFLTDEKSEEALKLIYAVRDAFESSYELDFMPSLWKYITTPTLLKFIKNMDIIIGFSSYCANETSREIQSRKIKNHEKAVSLMESMIEMKDVKFAVVTGVDLILGGISTVSYTVGTTLAYLAAHPEKQEKLFQEVKSILPEKTTPLANSSFDNMNYLKATIKEALRLRPVLPGNSRVAVRDVVIGGYRIPKGTQLLSAGLITAVDERNFSEPDKFLPERWLTSKEDSGNSFANIPFGSGARMCIGRRFADLQMQTLLAKIIRNFEVTYDYGEMEWKISMHMKPAKPLKFKIADRRN